MISCRELLPSDLEVVFDVRVKTWHNPNGAEAVLRLGITREAVREMMRHSHRGWVAEEEHRIVGFTMSNRQTVEMWVIAVRLEFENLGIGKRLTDLVEAWLWSAGWPDL
jgi:ribosomal protein S18 acetylase RimI-like enzyme